MVKLNKKNEDCFKKQKIEASSTQGSQVAPSPKSDADGQGGVDNRELIGDSNSGGGRTMWMWLIGEFVVAVLGYFLITGGKLGGAGSTDSTEVVVADTTTTEQTNSTEMEQPGATHVDNATTHTSIEKGQPQAGTAKTTEPVASPDDTVEQQARQVIRGVYGNNPERRSRLGAAYGVVQRRVNLLMRQ